MLHGPSEQPADPGPPEEAEKGEGEESESDAASMSQHGQSEITDEEFADKRILNLPFNNYENWPNDLVRGLPAMNPGAATGEPSLAGMPTPLTGFAADLSDCEDGREDDLVPYPKKWKKNGRKWAKTVPGIAALKNKTSPAFHRRTSSGHSTRSITSTRTTSLTFYDYDYD